MIACTQLADGLIVLVQKGYVAMTVTVPGIVVALKAKENVLALPSSSLEIGGPDRVDAVA